MATRITVSIDCEKVSALMAQHEWNNSAFSRRVGKYRTWYGEVLRGRNLPSPEEAAKMCVLLDAEPEDILLTAGETDEETAKLRADIETVRGLIVQRSEKESPAAQMSSGVDKEILDIVRSLDADQKETALAVLQALVRKKGK